MVIIKVLNLQQYCFKEILSIIKLTEAQRWIKLGQIPERIGLDVDKEK